MQFRTRAIHIGQEADPSSGAVVPPIHLASTFVLPAAEGPADYDYARTGSPTRHAFEAVMASLDGGARAVAFASGMAAIQPNRVTMHQQPGDHYDHRDTLWLNAKQNQHQPQVASRYTACTVLHL